MDSLFLGLWKIRRDWRYYIIGIFLDLYSGILSFIVSLYFISVKIYYPLVYILLRSKVYQFSSVQFSHSVMSDSLQPHESQHVRPSCPYQLSEFTQTHVHRVGDAIQPSNPLSSPSPPGPNPSSIQVFSNKSTLRMRWPKYWSFSFSISPFNEYPGLISFRMDWLALLAVPGTLKSLLQHHSSKASTLRNSAFFTVQLSQP